MKRIISLLGLIVFIYCEITAQEFGSWIVPPYRFDIYNSGVETQNSLINPAEPYYFSDGAFENNGELLFYIIDLEVYDKNSSFVGYLDDNPSYEALSNEVEIINVPGQMKKFYVLWSVINYDPAQTKLKYNMIDCTSGTPVISPSQTITTIITQAAFAIANLQNNTRNLYIAKYGGLYKYHINNQGISFVSTIVNSSNPILNDASYFMAGNLEINQYENIIAWVPAVNCTEDLFIVNIDNQGNFISAAKYDVWLEIIAGIEFADVSGINNNVIFASCPGDNGGIKRINYLTGNILSPLTSDETFSKSFLEKATDGNIYVVSNDGSSLGRIYPASNAFVPNVVTGLNIKSSMSLSFSNSIYKLPEDKTIYSILNLQLQLVSYVSCPGYSNGVVTANPSGGTPPYSYLWTPGGYTTQTVTGLPEGLVLECCVTDSDPLSEPVCDEIEVTLDPDMFDLNTFTFNVPATITNWNKSIKEELRIGPSGRVTLINCDLQFGKFAKVIIEPDGELTLDNCVLTNYDGCDDFWFGIEVWGNANKDQLEYDITNHHRYQGMLTIKNGTRIENAYRGVLLSKYLEGGPGGGFIDSFNGGIIQVINNGRPEIHSAVFENCRQSVVFKKYKNIPYGTTTELDNISYLYNCYFNINNEYFGGEWWDEHIHLFQVKGIKIKGCRFENNKTTTHSGHGINAWQAGFVVDAICNGNYLPPCPEYALDKCYFKKFTKAVNLANGSPYTLSVKNSVFEDNSNGVVMSNVSNGVVILNDFKIGYYANDEGLGCVEKGVSYGIDMANCKGFSIEENKFSKYLGAPTGNYTGIRANACPSASDNIYLNEFVGLSQGNLAQGYNRSEFWNDATGVAYLCNQNLNNSYDFYVGTNSMIRGKMGGLTSPAGNVLTNPAVSIMQFQNDGTQNVEYFYNVNEPAQWLTEYSTYLTPIPINYNNTCPSHYGGGGGGTGGRIVLTDEEVLQKEQEYYSGLNNYNNVVSLYESLKDGGNTEQLQSEVATAWPSEMWALRTELLGKSPHLSKEVLMTAADKTDVLPETVIFEIMAANPDELRKEDIISYLENKVQPLPGYMIDILRQVATGVTYKTALKCQMSAYHSQKVNAANDIIRSILNDSISDYNNLRNWLDNIGSYEADKQIIASYINDSVYATALNLLQILPSLYELSGDQLTEYNQYKSFTEWLIGLYQQNRTIYELDSIEIVNLVNIAENGSGDAKYGAWGILEFAYGYHYCDCPQLPEIAGLKNSKIITDNGINDFGLLITAQPNPSKEWVAFNFRLPPGLNDATVKIIDITGKAVDLINLNGNVGQVVWDSRKVNPGVYFYTLNAGNVSKSDKIIIE